MTLVFCVALFLGPTAWANYEQGLRAFNAAAYGEAEKIWQPLAEAGDARAQYALGVLYETRAAGDPEAMARAAAWYERAAAQGHAGAMTNLGSLYAQGAGVERDKGKAVSLWASAAEQGNAMAYYNLGLAYYRGEGVMPDIARSRAWFRRAAEGGLAAAQYALGQLHAEGVGVPRDKAVALGWFERAEQQGHAPSAQEAARLRSEGVQSATPGPAPVLPEEEGPQLTEAPEAAPAPMPPQPEQTKTAAPEAISEKAEPEAAAEKTAPRSSLTPEALAYLEGGKTVQQQPSTPAPAPSPDPAVTASIPPPSQVPEENGHVVWLGTFGAKNEAEDFRRKTLDLYSAEFRNRPISIVPLGGGTGHRVLAQGMIGEEAAESFCQLLRQRIANAFCAVVKL